MLIQGPSPDSAAFSVRSHSLNNLRSVWRTDAARPQAAPAGPHFGRCTSLSHHVVSWKAGENSVARCPSQSSRERVFQPPHLIPPTSPRVPSMKMRPFCSINSLLRAPKHIFVLFYNFTRSPKRFCWSNGYLAVQLPKWPVISIDPSPRPLTSPAYSIRHVFQTRD